jgi:hypothetical protein
MRRSAAGFGPPHCYPGTQWRCRLLALLGQFGRRSKSSGSRGEADVQRTDRQFDPHNLAYEDRTSADAAIAIARADNERQVAATKRSRKFKTHPATFTVVEV